MSMRVGIQGWGSEGDLRPLVALAARLRVCGHAPRLVFTPVDGKDYGPLCRTLGVPLQLIPEQAPITLQQLVQDAKSVDPTQLMKTVLDRTFYPYLDAMYTAALDLCESCDVLVGGSSSWPVKAATLRAGVPFASVHYYPGIVPSRKVPPAILPAWRWLARPGWALLKMMMDMAFREPARKFFADKGLPPVRHAIPDVLFSNRLNLLAASPAFWPPAPDWSESFCVSGELLMPPEVEPWQPSASLRAFLEAGTKPVLMSLGSMEHMAPERARDLLVGSARLAKTRAIIQTKTGQAEGQDGDLYFLSWAPHRLLGPACSAFVHHGGAGTTHAALRAGLPSVVLPFIFEQGLWARRLAQVGASTRRISFWKATPEQVARRIREAVESEPLRTRATALASAMAGEDGTGVAMRRLESLANEARG
jgi:UDP:flavonoid glycosyltransferase YjiC (YdhE family)